MIEALIKVREPDNWFEWRGVRYTLPVATYGLGSLLATINAAQSECRLWIQEPVTETSIMVVQPLDSGDAWTMNAGRGILYFLGLDHKTSDANNPGGDPVFAYGDIPPSIFWNATVRRRFAMQPKFSGQHSHRVTGTVAWGQQRAEDLLVLDFPEADAGLWCRFADQIAAGLLVTAEGQYFLLDDAVTPERRDGVLRVELAVVEA